MNSTIHTYNASQVDNERAICEQLASIIDTKLANTENKIWHGHPVWFIDGNPIVGYAKLKNAVQLLFWSGQSFDEPSLSPEGSFKAAEARYTDVNQINEEDLNRWLDKSITIQWDYKNIVKKRGVLDRLK
jgi:hypothetical protein